MVKFRDVDVKKSMFSACRVAKPIDLYANDDLTPLKTSIIYGLRQARKRFPQIVDGCGSRDGKVYVFTKPPNPTARNQNIFVNTMQRMEELCTRSFYIPAEEIMIRSSKN